jgi:activating signal cointegrator 1
MKVLSLTQPWASLVISGHKTFETRGWQPSAEVQRELVKHGLLIHASVTRKYGGISCRELCYKEPFASAVGSGQGYDRLPFGAIIGHVSFLQCIPTETFAICKLPDFGSITYGGHNISMGPREEAFGDYSDNRFAWQLTNPVAFPHPIPAKGSLNLWEPKIQVCVKCGCTENNCRQCIEKSGSPCHWAAPFLCSSCL